jgi:uncharacterized protein YbjT (DUF2867 family)
MKFLITGATGRVGRNLVEQLYAQGHEVRALTRGGKKAIFSPGVAIIVGDLTNPQSFAAALEGVDGLHLINFGSDDYAPLQTGQQIVDMAQAAGVKRVTMLRGGAETSVEEALKASSLAWTFLEPVEFMSGAEDYAESIRSSGEVRQPYPDRQTAAVHDADIASVAVSVLTRGGYARQSLVITGPEVLSPRKMVQTIGAQIGSDIRFVELTEDQARAEWAAAGMPQEFIEFAIWAYGSTPEVGQMVKPTVEQVTGRPGRTFAQWAAENADQFRTAEAISR